MLPRWAAERDHRLASDVIGPPAALVLLRYRFHRRIGHRC